MARTLPFLALTFALATTAQAQNAATISQVGNTHLAEITQSGGVNTGTLTQTGTNNRGGIGQGTDNVVAGTATGNLATVVQSGADNSGMDQTGRYGPDGSVIVQGAHGATATDNRGTTTQGGDRGYVQVVQGVGINAVSLRNVATVDQQGLNGEAVINQGFGPNATSTDNRADLVQASGSDNRAQIEQGFCDSATGGTATVRQVGFGNDFLVAQHGNSNAASVTMTIGDGNTARVFQTATALGSGNDATTTFAGDLNTALVTQMGDGNSSTVTVVGNANMTTVTQN